MAFLWEMDDLLDYHIRRFQSELEFRYGKRGYLISKDKLKHLPFLVEELTFMGSYYKLCEKYNQTVSGMKYRAIPLTHWDRQLLGITRIVVESRMNDMTNLKPESYGTPVSTSISEASPCPV